MSEPAPEPLDDERLTALVAECDEALAAGAPVTPMIETRVPAELRSRLHSEIAWCRVVRELLGSGVPTVATPTDQTPEPFFANLGLDRRPQQLGRFTIRRELGRGGFGVVFLAYDAQLRREVALKVPRAEALVTPELRARFRKEARAAAGLDHPNLVPVYDAGEEDHVSYIASAYCPGITLAQWLRNRTEPVPYRAAARLIAQLADAIDHAHRRGVLHRDLKPANVLLEPAPEPASAERPDDSLGFIPRVADFGLAKLVEADPEASLCHTETGAILGTPNYMAPEQAEGRQNIVGPAVDIYSLGAMLYELLTGQPIFRADTPVDVLLLLRTRDPLPPSRLRPRIPRDLETVCLKAVQREPHKRYACAGDLADDLRRYLAGQPIKARPTSRLDRAVLWCRRNPHLATTVGLATLAVVIVTAIAFYQVIQERDRFRHQRDRARANLARALYGEAQAQLKARDTGWWWNAMDNLREAAGVTAASDLPELRELAIESMGTDATSFRLHRDSATHPASATTVALSPDGKLMVSGASDGSARVWSFPDCRPLATLARHQGKVTDLVFLGQTRWLASSADDGQVRLWNVSGLASQADREPALEPVTVLAASRSGISALAAAPDGSWLVAGCRDGSIQIMRLTDQAAKATGVPRLMAAEPSRMVPGHTRAVLSVTFMPTGTRFATGSSDQTVRIWEATTGQQVDAWPVGDSPNSIAFTTAGDHIAWSMTQRFGFSLRGLIGEPYLTGGGQLHTGYVTRLRYLATGEWMTSAMDGTVRVWRSRTGSSEIHDVGVARGHFGAALAFDVSRDKHWAAAAYDDGRVRVWEMAEPPQRGFVPRFATPTAAFVAGERRLATNNAIYDVSAGLDAPTVRVFQPETITALALHPSSSLFAFGRRDGTLELWDLAARTRLVQWHGHTGAVVGLAGDPSGTRVTSASADGTVALWDWKTAAPLRVDHPGLGPLHTVGWSRDGHSLAASGDRGAAAWNADGSGTPRTLSTQPQLTSSLSFGAGVVAHCGKPGTVEVRDSESGRLLHTLDGHPGPVSVIEFAPDGHLLATACEARIRLWDTSTGREINALSHVSQAKLFLTFDPNGRYLVADSHGGMVVWDLRTSSLAVQSLTAWANAGRFTADGKRIVFGTTAGAVGVVTVDEFEKARTASGTDVRGAVRWDADRDIIAPGRHVDSIWGIAASSDGRWIATGSHDRTVKLWDANTAALVHTLIGHRSFIWSVAFSADSQTVASGSHGDVRTWDVASGQQTGQLGTGNNLLVTSLAFHPTEPWLIFGADGGSVNLWNWKTREPSRVVHTTDQDVSSVAISPDGRWLAAGCHNRRVYVWDLQRLGSEGPRHPDHTLEQHTSAVWSVNFAADGRYLASGADQGVIILWDGSTFRRVVTLRGGTTQVRAIAFSRDGGLLAGAAYAGPTIIWDLAQVRATLGSMGLDW